MYRIGIAEDEEQALERLQEFLSRYAGEHSMEIAVTPFSDGQDLVEGYRPIYDLLLIDIEMPRMNGMEAAGKIRRTDPLVPIIFVTNLARYAVRGYEVGAIDFVVKPVSYYAFAMKLRRALALIEGRQERSLIFPLRDGFRRVSEGEIRYIEINGHQMTVHLKEESFVVSGTLRKIEEQVTPGRFARCNSCYLVNLSFVSAVEGDEVTVGGDRLRCSRPKRKAFLEAVTNYMGVWGR